MVSGQGRAGLMLPVVFSSGEETCIFLFIFHFSSKPGSVVLSLIPSSWPLLY